MRLNWGRVLLSVIIAEVLPIVVLVVIVIVYGMNRSAGSPTAEEFAPRAGNWVGPIGGFLATLVMARWCVSGANALRLAHGLAVGVGTALLDIVFGFCLGGRGAVETIFIVSNLGRVLAGFLGYWLASKGCSTTPNDRRSSP